MIPVSTLYMFLCIYSGKVLWNDRLLPKGVGRSKEAEKRKLLRN